MGDKKVGVGIRRWGWVRGGDEKMGVGWGLIWGG